jgi:hypothetical protein
MNKFNVRKQFPRAVKDLMHEMIWQVEDRVQGARITDLPRDYEVNTKMKLWKIPKLFTDKLSEETVARQLAIANLPASYEIPEPYLMSGLSLLDCTGRVILPAQKLEESDAVRIKREKDMLEAMNQPDDALLAVEKESNGSILPLGLKIRIWDKVEVDVDTNTVYERGIFLGQVTLGRNDLINPPKGIRLYPLMDDDRYPPHPGTEKLKITGNISVKVTVTRKERVEDEEELIPCAWKCEILRANKISVLNEKTLVNPYCEVLTLTHLTLLTYSLTHSRCYGAALARKATIVTSSRSGSTAATPSTRSRPWIPSGTAMTSTSSTCHRYGARMTCPVEGTGSVASEVAVGVLAIYYLMKKPLKKKLKKFVRDFKR